MSDTRRRAQNILQKLPLSRKQRELYERGANAMDDEALERTTSKLESALARAPQTLTTARGLMTDKHASSPKHVLVVVEDDDYRDEVSRILGNILYIEFKIPETK